MANTHWQVYAVLLREALGVGTVLAQSYTVSTPASHHLWHVEDAADVEWGIRLVVQSEAGLIISLSDIAVEFLMLRFTDVLWVHHPDGLEIYIKGEVSCYKHISQ